MRKTWLFVAAVFVIGVAVLLLALSGRPRPAAANDTPISASLPLVMKPENTPTPLPTPTATATNIPPPTPTPRATPSAGENWLVNGSFENRNWTNQEPVEGYLINQEPYGWELDWLEKGERVWDFRTMNPQDQHVGIVTGIAEMLHKLDWQLPDEEKPGGPKALILDGEVVYKVFHSGAAFGTELTQTVSLPPGKWRLTVPVQLHWQERLDPADPTWDTYTAESGAWVSYGNTRHGGWATARDMGDRRWYYHVVEFTLPAQTNVQVLLRFKSIYHSAKDFFIDAVWLEPVQ